MPGRHRRRVPLGDALGLPHVLASRPHRHQRQRLLEAVATIETDRRVQVVFTQGRRLQQRVDESLRISEEW